MQLMRDLRGLRAQPPGCVATIGVFDGMHLGHQEMLRVLKIQGARTSLPTTVISFEPSPREFFARQVMPADVPARLTLFREKFELFTQRGVDRFACLRFDARMAAMTAEEFVGDLLVGTLGTRVAIVGHDFCFGYRRTGTVDTLRQLGAPLGLEVEVVPPFVVDGERVSSSLVRAALASGNLYRAQRLLGRPYSLSGRVVAGARLGRTLGFPTANLRLYRRTVPLQGVFAVRVSGGGLDDAPAVANLGTRPAVTGLGSVVEPLLEVHVFDYAGDLYSRRLSVRFVARLRDERWFPSLEAMTQQMHEDAAQARDALAASARGQGTGDRG